MRCVTNAIFKRFVMCAFGMSAIVLFTPSIATADSLARLLKRTAGVGDDIPLKSTDDVLARLKKLPTFRPSDEALKTAGQAALRNPEDLRAAAIMVDGAKRLDDAVPDLALRGNLIRRGGNDAIQAAGMRVGAADDLLYLDRYLARPNLDLTTISRRPTMADFAAVVANDGRWKFWQTYVAPNKKVWAGGAALAAYLVAPEMWHDAAGNLTEKGLALAGDLGGELLAGVLRGVKDGGEKLGEKIADEIPPLVSTSFVGWLGIIAIVAIATVLLLATLRQRAFAMVKRLVVGAPSKSNDADSF
jgi:hypothetical protein